MPDYAEVNVTGRLIVTIKCDKCDKELGWQSYNPVPSQTIFLVITDHECKKRVK
jgi:hypothetical protein